MILVMEVEHLFLRYRKLRTRAMGRCRMRPRWLREFRKRNSLFFVMIAFLSHKN